MTETLKEFSELIDLQRPHEAFVLFLEQVENKSWVELSTLDLAMLDMLCQQALPQLRENHTLWMVNHPDRLRRMLQLLTEALAVNYHPAAMVDHIAWLRCLLAIEAAMTGHIERVHEELCLVQQEGSIPKPNGEFRKEVRSIQLKEKSTIEFLDPLFRSYLEFLKRVGRHEFCNQLENRITPLLKRIARDERCPGVVQAMFYDKIEGKGHLRFIHVSTKYLSDSNDAYKAPSKEAILYTGKGDDIIDATMQEAVTCARQTADAYLKSVGYPDGLTSRLVRWEIADTQGDSVKLERRFQGGSLGLPLAVAIVSQYLAKPVPNDTTFTGAFTAASAANGRILPVDGVPEKVKHAALSGSQFIYIPAANATELNSKSTLQNLIQENNSKVIAVETFDEVCKELFPLEGSGQLKDLIKDAFGSYLQIFKPILHRYRLASGEFAYQRYPYHVLACSILTMLLVLLESWMMCKTCAPDFSSIGIWFRIIAVVILAFVGISFSFVLPDTCLKHRKRWSWIAATILLAVCLSIGGQLLIPVIPGLKPANLSPNILPTAFFLKDMFLIWVFTWLIAADSFNVVAGAEHLLKNRQFITARECLKWDSLLEIRMPILCIYFPWKWATTAVIAVALILIAWEMRFFSSILKKGSDATHQLVVIGICRELLFLVVISEVLIFYKTALARIRKMFS